MHLVRNSRQKLVGLAGDVAEAARQAIALARDEAARSVDSAQRQAMRTRQLAGQRMSALVNHTVDAIRQLEAIDT